MNEPPQKPKIMLEGNTFRNVGTAVKTSGAIDITGKDNKFTKVETVIDSDNSKEQQNHNNNWHEKPIGKIAIAVVAGLVLTALIWGIRYYVAPALGF